MITKRVSRLTQIEEALLEWRESALNGKDDMDEGLMKAVENYFGIDRAFRYKKDEPNVE